MEKALTKKKILFVDDEKRWVTDYVEELQDELSEDYEVVLESDVDKALRYFEEHLAQLALLILDIMMPPGSSFTNGETHAGMRTGVSFYEAVRRTAPNLPVIILTNASEPDLRERFRQEKSCMFLAKLDTLPDELAEHVRSFLEKSNK
jgi:CheY-like chemotaxis protein